MPIKGLLNDFRTKFDPAKGFTETAPGGVPPTKKADPMSGIFGDGGGGAGGMLGPLAALTIVGQGTFDMVKKAVGILAQASPALGASLKLIQRTLMMTLKPIGDLLASFLRPIARTMREMHRRAHQAALQKGARGAKSMPKNTITYSSGGRTSYLTGYREMGLVLGYGTRVVTRRLRQHVGAGDSLDDNGV